MLKNIIKLLFSIILLFCVTIETAKGHEKDELYKYTIKQFEVPLDHFSYTSNGTFKIRYLINDSFVQSDNDPIFFYTGNEGDIELFAQNTGFMWETAEQINALLIFAEHRYYGQSLPFGNKSYVSPSNLGYLSSQQALADYASLIRSINKENRPVIAFGGSYGGMLAAWLRMKYEHLVTGAIAASAPIFQFEDLTPCDAFNRILTSVFATAYKPQCAVNIKKSWNLIKNAATTQDGRNKLFKDFNLCKNMTDIKDGDIFIDYLTDVYGNLAMVNYPYETSFLAPLPAYPVRQFCGQFSDKLNDTDILPALARAIQVYTNYSSQAKCLDISSAYANNMGDEGWKFQSCTEMVMPMCSGGFDDMFLPEKWDIRKFSDKCFEQFGVRPRDQAAVSYYGDKRLAGASNIVFSNGLLDPWSGGGVLRTDNDRINIIIIPDGAHHFDLRASNKVDPESVRYARKSHVKFIKNWIQMYYRKSY